MAKWKIGKPIDAKPCPACDSLEVFLWNDTGTDDFFVECDGCGRTGPEDSAYSAVDRWNEGEAAPSTSDNEDGDERFTIGETFRDPLARERKCHVRGFVDGRMVVRWWRLGRLAWEYEVLSPERETVIMRELRKSALPEPPGGAR